MLKELKAAEKEERKTSALQKDHHTKNARCYSEKGDLNAAQCLKRLQQCEDLAKVFKKCKWHSNGIYMIEVPTDPDVHPMQCNEWKTVDCPKAIEEHPQARNPTHFGQAQGTPLTVPPLSQSVDFEAASQIMDMILSGSYTHEDISMTTQLLIDHLQRKTPLSVSSTLTEEEFLGKLKHWRENTSTYPSGVHLGHLKAYDTRSSCPR